MFHKPGKADYTIPKAHRPTVLTDTIVKVLSSCIAKAIVKQTERLGLLPSMHFRGRPRRATMDMLQLMVNFIKNPWRKGNVVSMLFLDIKVAFPSIAVSWLLHNMRDREEYQGSTLTGLKQK